MAGVGGSYGKLTGLTKSTDHPSIVVLVSGPELPKVPNQGT